MNEAAGLKQSTYLIDFSNNGWQLAQITSVTFNSKALVLRFHICVYITVINVSRHSVITEKKSFLHKTKKFMISVSN